MRTVKALLAAGFTQEDIATAMNIPLAEVRQFTAKPTPMTREAWEEADAIYPDASERALKRIYNASCMYRPLPKKAELSPQDLATLGSTHSEIAKVVGKSRTWVTSRLGKTGTKNSTPNKVKNWAEVIEYRKANSLAATAKRFGVSSAAISQYMKRHGYVFHS